MMFLLFVLSFCKLVHASWKDQGSLAPCAQQCLQIGQTCDEAAYKVLAAGGQTAHRRPHAAPGLTAAGRAGVCPMLCEGSHVPLPGHTHSIPPTAYYPPHTTHRIPPTAYHPPPTAYHPPHTARMQTALQPLGAPHTPSTVQWLHCTPGYDAAGLWMRVAMPCVRRILRRQDIFDHAFFHNLDWDALLAKDLKPPWVPKLQNEMDTSHFEEYDEGDKPWNNVDMEGIDVNSALATFSEF